MRDYNSWQQRNYRGTSWRGNYLSMKPEDERRQVTFSDVMLVMGIFMLYMSLVSW